MDTSPRRRATPGAPVPPPVQTYGSAKARKGDPSFRELWRKFQLRVHPDLFARFPELQTVNDASLKRLQGVLNEAKTGERTTDEFMKPKDEKIEFYVRTDRERDHFLRIPVHLKLPGGDCRHLLADTLGRMFAHAGLPARFHWGPEYWGSTYTLPIRREGEDFDD